MNERKRMFLIIFVATMIVLILSDKFFGGGPESRVIPGAYSDKSWAEVYAKLDTFAILSLILTSIIYYFTIRKK